MPAPSPLDRSLYESVANFQPSLVSPLLSPAAFKSAVGAVLDVLRERSIAAVLWAKLPRGMQWQVELDRYITAQELAKAVYWFESQRAESSDEGSSSEDSVAIGGFARKPNVSTIPLPPDSPLRREYFLCIWAAELQCTLIARRSRTKATIEENRGTEAGEDSADKKQLMALFSVDATVLEHALAELEQSLSSPATETAGSEDATGLAESIPRWKQLTAELTPVAPTPALVSHLLTLQLQRQEDVWQRYSTYRKQAELAESLQLQNEELLTAVRLKDDFLNNVGQELRTPLTTIKTALTLLNSPSLKPPQRQRYMDLIAKECDRQSSLITSLLDLVQLDQMAEQTAQKALKLSDVVPGVVSTYQPLAEEKGVMLAYTVPEDLPQVACVNSWVKQIVINLLHNGIKFTPRGGQVWVRAKAHSNDYVQIEFRDTGIGIPAAEIPKIFDRFYRVRQSGEESSGAGLGLTIVQQLLIHCGGSISVRSRVGEGSTFQVLLPIHKASSESSRTG